MVEFAKNAVKPINRLNVDFSKVPTKVGNDVKIGTPPNINVKVQSSIHPREIQNTFAALSMQEEIDSLLSSSGEMIDVDTFTPYLRKQLVLA